MRGLSASTTTMQLQVRCYAQLALVPDSPARLTLSALDRSGIGISCTRAIRCTSPSCT